MCAHTYRESGEHASSAPHATTPARPPATGVDAALRVSDAEREAAVEELRRHAGTGRLEPDELDERLETALAARTRGELETVLRDLPAARLPRGDALARVAAPWTARFATYLWIMALLVAIWAFTGAGHPWPLYPALGWGIPLLVARPSRQRTGVA